MLTKGGLPTLQDIVYRTTFEYDPVTDAITFWYSGARYERWTLRLGGGGRAASRAEVFAPQPAAAEANVYTPAPAPLEEWPSRAPAPLADWP